jgi:dihydrofolate reductase
MRKIIVNLCCSLDGFIEGSNGEIDWCFTDQDYGMTEFLNSIDTIIFGRHSYVQLLDMAPDAFKDKKKVVCSTSLSADEHDVLIISEDLKGEIHKLIAQPGKDIWFFGGAKLMSTFLKHDLIDDMMIAVHPIVLGSGKALFTDINHRKELILSDTKTYSTGLVQLIYTIQKS